MTTIAYRNGELAGDTRMTSGDTVLPETCRKVFKFPDGRLFGACGNAEEGFTLLKATKKNLHVPKLKDVNAFLVKADGTLWYYERAEWSKVSGDFAAIGSGASFALGALFMGADARRAVKAGCKFDKNSGGRVYVVRLEKKCSAVETLPPAAC